MTVTAPNSGVADVVNVRVGEAFVGATAQGPQIRIVNTSDLKVVADVPENYLSKVNVGSNVEIVLPEENNRIINAKVTVVGKSDQPFLPHLSDRSKNTFQRQFKTESISQGAY